MDSDLESKLISLICQLPGVPWSQQWPKVLSIITQIVTLVGSMDLDLKPESKLMSLVTQTISFFNSIDLDSQPKPLSKFLSVIITPLVNSTSVSNFESPMDRMFYLQPEPEIMSRIRLIISLAISMHNKWEKLISLNPQVHVTFNEGKFRVEKMPWISDSKWTCLRSGNWEFYTSRKGEGATHFHCKSCHGKHHEEYEKAPVEIKHALHPKHSLQLVLTTTWRPRKCYCCDEDLEAVFYYCSACDFSVNFACAEKPPLLSIDHSKWHKHPIALFSRTTSLTCDLCALADSSYAFYICLPCGFVVHRGCLNLPHVIRISRHPHRLSFTHSFDQGKWVCSVCRKKIDNDYGSFSCVKNGCPYAAHSRCATQSNVWDGNDLEGVPEEIEEKFAPPFVRIGDGIIRHFSHQHRCLKLDENTTRDYDEDKMCHACVTPIYFGNFYSCMQCKFILHEKCANLYRKLYHPIHRHMLTLALAGGNNSVVKDAYTCNACGRAGTTGFFYECSKGKGCHPYMRFKLHVQCAIATISEPLVHGSHIHPLFLTTKPGEWRKCSVCHFDSGRETFNCIDSECEFSLCFGCTATPEKVMYKHDKHMLTLSCGNEKGQETYWCEACEGKIKPKEWI